MSGEMILKSFDITECSSTERARGCESFKLEFYLLKMNRKVFVCVFCLTSRSTIFQSCWDGATDSWVYISTLGSLKCLAQGHRYTAVVGFEICTSRSGV